MTIKLWQNFKAFIGFPSKDSEYQGFLSNDDNLRFFLFTALVSILLITLIALVCLIVRRLCYRSKDDLQLNETMVESALLQQLSEKIHGSTFSIDSAKFLNIKSSKNDRPYYLKRVGTDPMLNLEPKTKKTDNVFSMPDISELLSRQSSESRSTNSQSISLDQGESNDSNKTRAAEQRKLATDWTSDRAEYKTFDKVVSRKASKPIDKGARAVGREDDKVPEKEADAVGGAEEAGSERTSHVVQIVNKPPEKVASLGKNEKPPDRPPNKLTTGKSSPAVQRLVAPKENPRPKIKSRDSLPKVKSSHGRLGAKK